MLKTPRAERVLIDALDGLPDCERILCTTLGRAQSAAALAERIPRAAVFCLFLDLFARDESRDLYPLGPENLALECAADFPETDADLVAFPLSARGEAELTRELLQQGVLRLRTGGRLFASTDRPDDTWLHQELQKLFSKVQRRESRFGAVYAATKTRELKKEKNFECRFAFRDAGRLIQVVSRPGVFSHRRLDTGARALMEGMEIRDGERVFEIGCGSGAVSFAAALRAEDVKVQAVDSNARAVQCTRLGAEVNGLSNVAVLHNADAECADAECDRPGTFDVVVANPPYYSRGRLWELFIRGAVHALNPDGRLYVVTKNEAWYRERLELDFVNVSVFAQRNYKIVAGEGLKR